MRIQGRTTSISYSMHSRKRDNYCWYRLYYYCAIICHQTAVNPIPGTNPSQPSLSYIETRHSSSISSSANSCILVGNLNQRAHGPIGHQARDNKRNHTDNCVFSWEISTNAHGAINHQARYNNNKRSHSASSKRDMTAEALTVSNAGGCGEGDEGRHEVHEARHDDGEIFFL